MITHWMVLLVCLGFALQAYGTISGLTIFVFLGSWLVTFAKTLG